MSAPSNWRPAVPALRRTLRRAAAMAVATPRFGARMVHVVRMKLSGVSDYQRWGDVENLETWWTPRTTKLAALIPAGSAIIEFGAGRRQLERFLPVGTTYVPSDLVDRGPGTLICDLNKRPLPDLQDLGRDTAVFSGVLEYVVDVAAVVDWLAPTTRYIVTSYAFVDESAGSIEGALHHVERVKNGYMNHYTQRQFVAMFEAHGFAVARTDTWESQALFLFQRRAA